MTQTYKTTKKNNIKPATSRKGNKKEPSAKIAMVENRTPSIIWGIVFLLLSACVFVSYFYNEGAFIVYFSNIIKGIIGYGYWAVGVCFFIIFYLLCIGEHDKRGLRIAFSLLFPVFFSGVLHLITYGGDTTLDIPKFFESGSKLLSGGVLGSLLGYISFKLLSKVGGAIVLSIILVIELLVILGANVETFKFSQKDNNSKPVASAPAKVRNKSSKPNDYQKGYSVQSLDLTDIPKIDNKVSSVKKSKNPYDLPLLDSTPDSKIIPANKSSKTTKTIKEDKEKIIPISYEKNLVDFDDSSKITDVDSKRLKKGELEKETRAVAKQVSENVTDTKGMYVYPPESLLKYGKDNGKDSKDEIQATKERLENTLHSFNVNSYVSNITPGPTVTRYDIQLEQGVKLSKVTNLAGDIALSLGVLNVRVAPIPDEISTVGIEVPNKIVNTVSLREIIESNEFRVAKSKLTFAIGKDIGGHAIVGNISKLPHMLIAGTTGSGKSVCMNSLIISLLYKARPDEVKFIMIDPKMVELGVYNSIPHLYVPVVTEPKKAAGALQWAVVEMLKRYKMFSEAMVRDLESFNDYCRANDEQPLPQVVIVIDELADLMMAASKEVEESICRIAQMGRAAGMHLIIATQRPSADVITGLMKANIPSRIAFAVSSAMESRIIMDTSGAEKLIGMGDMLYSPIGAGKPLRVQGSFVSDNEREQVINFIKEHSDFAKETNKELEQAMNNAASSGDSGKNDVKESTSSSSYDEVLPQAVDVILEMKSCSVSLLQRRLKLGYSRAARVVDQMEELGIVGPYEGAKPRSVEIDREGWNNIKINLGLASADDFSLASTMSEEYDDELSEDKSF